MARKSYARTKPEHLRAPPSDGYTYAAFMADLLTNTVQATQLIEDRPGGRLRLQYEDPDRPGAGQGGGGTRGT